MLNYYYSAVIFIAVFMMLILDTLVFGNDLMETKQKRRMYAISVLLIIGAVSEWLGVLLNGTDTRLRVPHIIIKVLELGTAPIIPILCSELFGKLKLRKFIISMLAINAFLEILSGFLGFIFYVDDANVYKHGTFYGIYIISYMAGVMYFLHALLRECKKYYASNHGIIFLIITFFLSGLIMQYVASGVRVIWLCTAVDVLMVYSYFSELTQRTDALTHLLNRRSYESRLSHMKESTTIFFFDVDSFKSVNDTYGHAFGDATLTGVAEAIHSVFGKKGHCYRIGGDEFCAMICGTNGNTDKYIYDFLQEMKNRRSADHRLPRVSVGYADFVPGEGSVEDAIHEADLMMYDYKREQKKEVAN